MRPGEAAGGNEWTNGKGGSRSGIPDSGAHSWGRSGSRLERLQLPSPRRHPSTQACQSRPFLLDFDPSVAPSSPCCCSLSILLSAYKKVKKTYLALQEIALKTKRNRWWAEDDWLLPHPPCGLCSHALPPFHYPQISISGSLLGFSEEPGVGHRDRAGRTFRLWILDPAPIHPLYVSRSGLAWSLQLSGPICGPNTAPASLRCSQL